MFRKYKPYFDNKSCDICGEKANIYRVIKDKKYMLCGSNRCDFLTRVKNGWHIPLVK